MEDVKIIEVIKGYEDRFLIEKNLGKTDKFFYYAYKRSADLINEICSARYSMDNENAALGKYYPNNIIVYCAERGGGKSTAMLSVANSLIELKKIRDNMNELNAKDMENELYRFLSERAKHSNFFVLSPIDPCSISSGENFMRITISRMFSDLRMRWDERDKSSKQSGGMQKMYERSEVVEKFTECYKLLDFIYNNGKNTNSDSDLEELTELGDFSRLKNRFEELVNCYLEQIYGSTKDNYLVMLVDDADLNTQKSFEIIEDIRKYCIIPNVILLMAVNMDQMHQIIEQHFYVEFKALLDYNRSASFETPDTRSPKDMTVRYLNKILPATHQIHLPVISEIIQNDSSRLELMYTERSEQGRKDILTFSSRDYQERLINLIHKKTGVDLVKPEHYLHNFIPGNMRDLTHFLSYFNALPDIDDYGYADMYAAILDPDENSHAQEAISRRLSNLDALQIYFIYNWCDRNLSKENYQIILKLADAVESIKISSAIKIVSDIIRKNGGAAEENSEYTYAELMRLISVLSGNARSQRDFMQTYKLVFALRMFFTIFLHREMLNGLKNNDFNWLFEITGGVLWHFDYAKIFGTKYRQFGHFLVNIEAAKRVYITPEDDDGEIIKSHSLERMRISLSKYCYELKNGNYKGIAMLSKGEKEESLENKTIVFDISRFLLSLLTSPEYYKPNSSAQLACLNHLYNVLINWDVFHQVTKYAEGSDIITKDQLVTIKGNNALINLLCGTNKIPASDNAPLLDLSYLGLNNDKDMPDSFKVDRNLLYTNYDNIKAITEDIISGMRDIMKNIPVTYDKISDLNAEWFIQDSIMNDFLDCLTKLMPIKMVAGSNKPFSNIENKFRAVISTEKDIIKKYKSQKLDEDFFDQASAKMEKAVKDWRTATYNTTFVDNVMNAVAGVFGVERSKPEDSVAPKKSRTRKKKSADNTDPNNKPTGAETNEDAKVPSEDSVQSGPAGAAVK